MKTNTKQSAIKLCLIAQSLAVAGVLLPFPSNAALINLANSPLFVTTSVLPNIMVVLDNSESMDGTMPGKLIAGNDATTRSNIARSVMRNTITNYRTAFNWGLMSFDVTSSAFYITYAYYLGSNTGMIFTDGCSGTPLKTPGGQSCVVNPQPFTGGNYVTYDVSGDDASINDVLYTNAPSASQCSTTTISGNTYCKAIWSLTDGSNTGYYFYGNHSASTSWATNTFSGCPLGTCGSISLTKTDAGYVPTNPPITRTLYVPRAWGYGGSNSGKGKVNEVVTADSTTHYNNLMSYLASETSSSSSSEIKNSSTFTPLAGTMQSVKTYFSGGSTPITQSCQKNFAMLVTDGQPTADTSGNQYSAADQASGKPVNDTVAAITALRSTAVASFGNLDIQTYIVGLGDTVQNPAAITALNKMATAGGTGNAYLASDPTAFANAIQSIASSIQAKVGSASAVTVNSTQLATNTMVYQGSFSSADWSGQLQAFPLTSSGALGTAAWDAGQKLNAQNWDTGRTILTSNRGVSSTGGQGIPFRWPSNAASPTSSELNSTQITALNQNASGVADGQGQLRVQYLRGDKSNEGPAPKFRTRSTSVLGDIVDSNAIYVGKPAFSYPNSLQTASYKSFVTANAGRTPMVYVGANDGMLHGFDASTGVEKIAYIPTKVYSNLSKLTSPTYSHLFYVDGSPTVGDVFYAGAWHSVLVGSLRGGGQGIFALDVTNPSTFSENNAATTVLWEFNDSDDGTEYDLGYTYTRPMIVRMANGKWAAVFGNGYNNTFSDGKVSATGNAAIYIVDIQTGQLIKKLYTNTGSATTPNGFSTVTPVDLNNDNIVDYIYGADLLGNVWKFDVTSTSSSSWGSSYGTASSPLPLFTAKDSSNNVQPITGKITVGLHPISGNMVYFGTGQYLAVSDLTNTAQQTFYGIWDNNAPVSGRSVLLQQSVTNNNSVQSTGTFRISTSNGVASTMYVTPISKKGWYMDLPTSGERQITDPILNGSNVVFTTLIPDTTVCSSGGSGWIMELDAITGNMITDPIFPTSQSDFSASDIRTAGIKTSAIPSTPRIVSKQGISFAGGSGGPATPCPSNKPCENKLVSLSNGAIANQKEKSTISQKRVMWRQVQ